MQSDNLISYEEEGTAEWAGLQHIKREKNSLAYSLTKGDTDLYQTPPHFIMLSTQMGKTANHVS
jgi:hypothetical protein